MKKIVFLIISGIIVGIPSCKNPESPYEAYIVPNGLSYPGKVINAMAAPGKERIEISWKNATDPKVVKARISWNNDTEWVEEDIQQGTEYVKRMLEPMAENTYSFLIRTYDVKGNVSVPVEVISSVYGEMYERSLSNRSVNSAIFEANEGLIISWNGADVTEIGVNLEYTDINDNSRTLLVSQKETTTIIPDFKPGKPLFCTTLYKPDTLSIDIFQASTIRVSYTADMTGLLKNTQAPFARGENPVSVDRFYELSDWVVSPADFAANGNVDGNLNYGLVLYAYNTLGSDKDITNAKLYQTVELDAGTYQFTVFYYIYSDALPVNMNITAALGDELPDAADIAQKSLSFTPIVNASNLSIDFIVTEKNNVSIGFAGNLTKNQFIVYSRVELIGTMR